MSAPALILDHGLLGITVRYLSHDTPESGVSVPLLRDQDIEKAQTWIDVLRVDAKLYLDDPSCEAQQDGNALLRMAEAEEAKLCVDREAVERLGPSATHHEVFLRRPDVKRYYKALQDTAAQYPDRSSADFDRALMIELLPIGLGKDASEISFDIITLILWSEFRAYLQSVMPPMRG